MGHVALTRSAETSILATRKHRRADSVVAGGSDAALDIMTVIEDVTGQVVNVIDLDRHR